MNLTVEIRAKPEKFHELYQTLQALLPMMRAEDGCRDSRIYLDVEDGEVFFLPVHWEDVANLERYMRPISGSALLGAVDLLSETARCRIDEDAPWENINTLKRMRKGFFLIRHYFLTCEIYESFVCIGFNNFIVFYAADDAHGFLAFRTDEWINFVYCLN